MAAGSDGRLKMICRDNMLSSLFQPLFYMCPLKFTYVKYLSCPKAISGTSGSTDRLQTGVNDRPVRRNLYYLISGSCCTWSKLTQMQIAYWFLQAPCVCCITPFAGSHSFNQHLEPDLLSFTQLATTELFFLINYSTVKKVSHLLLWYSVFFYFLTFQVFLYSNFIWFR